MTHAWISEFNSTATSASFEARDDEQLIGEGILGSSQPTHLLAKLGHLCLGQVVHHQDLERWPPERISCNPANSRCSVTPLGLGDVFGIARHDSRYGVGHLHRGLVVPHVA
jgi:hypothetical protein